MSHVRQRSPMNDEEGGDAERGMNPLHIDSGKGSEGPSSAYMESLKRARESEHWRTASMASSSPRRSMEPGWRTKALIFFLFMTGVVLFITGCSFYFDRNPEGTQRKTGFDILLCSLIPLVPGLYGAFIWFGSAQGWHGYSLVRLSSGLG